MMNKEEIKNEFINCIEGSHTLNLAISVLEDRENLQQRIAMAQDYIRNESYLSDSEIDEVARILEGDYDAEEVEE